MSASVATTSPKHLLSISTCAHPPTPPLDCERPSQSWSHNARLPSNLLYIPTMTSLQTWQTFLSRSLATRLEPSDFESYVQLLSTKHPLPASRISDLFLRPIEYNNISLDPRIVRYVQVLLGLELITVPSVLRSLWKVSSFRGQSEHQNGH